MVGDLHLLYSSRRFCITLPNIVTITVMCIFQECLPCLSCGYVCPWSPSWVPHLEKQRVKVFSYIQWRPALCQTLSWWYSYYRPPFAVKCDKYSSISAEILLRKIVIILRSGTESRNRCIWAEFWRIKSLKVVSKYKFFKIKNMGLIHNKHVSELYLTH